MSMLKLALRNLSARPERFWPMAAGVFLLALSVLFSFGSIRELQLLRQKSLREMAAHQAQIIVIPRYSKSTGLRQSFQTLTALMGEIRRIPGAGRVDQLAQFFSAGNGDNPLHLTAVIPDPHLTKQSGSTEVASEVSFDRLSSPGTALLGIGLTEYPAAGAFQIMGFPLISAGMRGETHTNADKTVYLSAETAAAFIQHIDRTGQAGEFAKADEQSLIVTPAQGVDPLALSNRILRDVKNVYLFDGHSFFMDESKSLQAVQRSSIIIKAIIPGGLLLSLAVLFSVSVLGRKRELSVLRAIGASASFVRGMLLMENGIVGLLGGIAALLTFILYQLAFLPGIGFRLLDVLASLIAGVAGTLAATWIPAALLSRRDPARFMRG